MGVARSIAAEHADVVDREGRFPAEAVNALKAGRLLGLAAPSEFGGEGATLGELCAVASSLGEACASTAMVFAMHQICMANLIDCGTDSPWLRSFLTRAVTDQMLFASSTTERGVGGDLRQSICAVETGASAGAFALSKASPVISYAEHADALFVTARRDPEAAPSDQVLVVLVAGQYELERLSTWDALGMRGTCSHGYQVRGQASLAQVLPKAFADIAAESMVPTSHLLWSSVWSGVAADALARAQGFVAAEARKNPGAVPPGSQHLAEAFGRYRQLQAGLREGVGAWSDGGRAGAPTLSLALDINALKVSTSTTALQVVDAAMMVCGLEGYRNGGPYSVGRHLRDIHSARLMIGNDRILASMGQMLLMQRRSSASEF